MRHIKIIRLTTDKRVTDTVWIYSAVLNFTALCTKTQRGVRSIHAPPPFLPPLVCTSCAKFANGQ